MTTSSYRLLLASALFLLPLAPLSAQPDRKPIARHPEAKHGRGELKYYGKTPILIVAGSPAEIGEQLGSLERVVVKDFEKLIGAYVHHRGWDDVYPWLLKAGSLLEWNFPAPHRQEFAAAIKAGTFHRDELIFLNTVFDVIGGVACSTIVVEPSRSETGELIFGRNLDLPKFAYLHELTLVTVYHPKDKRSFASIGFPGLFGVVSGMNDAGLSIAVNEVLRSKDQGVRFNPLGTPKLLLLRRILEECATIEEAEKLLNDATRTGMMAVTICDRKEAAVLEVTSKAVVRRRADAGICACTNHFRTPELCVKDRCDRLDELTTAGRKEKLSVRDVGAALHSARLADLTMQTMIFEPASLRLHLAFGELPSSAMPRETIDLKALFAARPK